MARGITTYVPDLSNKPTTPTQEASGGRARAVSEMLIKQAEEKRSLPVSESKINSSGSGGRTRSWSSGSGGSGSSSNGSYSQPKEKIIIQPKPQPKLIIPPSQKERRAADLLSRVKRTTGRRTQPISKQKIHYYKQSPDEGIKRKEEWHKKKKPIKLIYKQLGYVTKEKQTKKIQSKAYQKYKEKQMEEYQKYKALQQNIQQETVIPIKIKYKEVLKERVPKEIGKIKWW